MHTRLNWSLAMLVARVMVPLGAAAIAAASTTVSGQTTVSPTTALRILSGGGADFGALSLYNDGGNIQRTFLQFDLSSYSGNSITTSATLTLQAGVFGDALTGVSIGTANTEWSGSSITWANQPSLTAIPGATNPDGTFGSGPVTWTIPWWMLEKMATAGSGYNNGLGLTSGQGSTQHFVNNPITSTTLTFSATTAATGTWTGGSGNWTDTANWAGGTVAQGIGQAATINGGSEVTITMDANRSVGSLSFSGANHTIGGGAGSLALNVVSPSSLPTIDVEASRTATIGAAVVGIGLAKSGTGTLVLSGSNGYTGTTAVTAGTLKLDNVNALGAWRAKDLAISNGGTLVTNWGEGEYNDLGTVTLGANGSGGGTITSNQAGNQNLGNFFLYGDVTVAEGSTSTSVIASDVRVGLNATRTFTVGDTTDPSGLDLLFSGKLGHFNGNSWGYVNKAGAGTMKLSGPLEIGGITVSAGTLILENAAANWTAYATGMTNSSQVEFAVTSGTSTIAAPIDGSGSVTKTGAGTLVLSNVSSYAGGTTVDAGTLSVAGNGGNGRIGGALTVNAAGTVVTTGDGTGFGYNDQLTSLVINGGTVRSEGDSHIWNITGGVSMAGGEMQAGALFQWNRTDLTTNASSTTAVISGGVNLRGDSGYTTWNVSVADGAAATDLLVSAVVSGGPGLVKSGPGTMVLSGNNTYTGGSTVNAGTIEIYGRSADNGGYTSLGTGTVTINTGGTLVSANDWSTGNNWNSGAVGLITVNSGGTWTINTAGNTVRNGLAVNGGTINGPGANGDWGGMFLKSTSVTAGGNATSTIAVDTAMDSQTTFTVDAGSRLDYTGVIHNAIQTNSGITKAGPGTLVLAAANTYTSPTIFEGGTVNAATFSDYGSNSSLGNRSQSADAGGDVGLLFRGGTLQYTGSTPQSTNRGIRLSTTGGTIDASGSDPSATLSFSALSSPNLLENPGNRTLNLTGSNQGNNSFAMAITEAGGTTAVVKNGVGRWVLTGTSTYTGGTDVNAGTLLVNGSLGATTVSVASAATLGGSGQIGGPVSILAGGILAPGTSPGTLTINDTLNLDGGSILSFEIDALSTVVGSGVNDLITGVTNLTLGGTLNLSGSGDFTAVTQGTTWRLIDYSGTLTDNTLSIGTSPTLAAGLSFTVDTSTANQVNLSVVPEPASLGLAALGLAAAGWLRLRRASGK